MLSGDYWVIVIGYVVQGGAARGRRRRPRAVLHERALPDRGAGDGKRLLLSPGNDLRWPRAAGRHLFCPELRYWVLGADADRLSNGRRLLLPGDVHGAGNQGQGNGTGSGAGLSRVAVSELVPAIDLGGPAVPGRTCCPRHAGGGNRPREPSRKSNQ